MKRPFFSERSKKRLKQKPVITVINGPSANERMFCCLTVCYLRNQHPCWFLAPADFCVIDRLRHAVSFVLQCYSEAIFEMII
jgi:hypothetical protein